MQVYMKLKRMPLKGLITKQRIAHCSFNEFDETCSMHFPWLTLNSVTGNGHVNQRGEPQCIHILREGTAIALKNTLGKKKLHIHEREVLKGLLVRYEGRFLWVLITDTSFHSLFIAQLSSASPHGDSREFIRAIAFPVSSLNPIVVSVLSATHFTGS